MTCWRKSAFEVEVRGRSVQYFMKEPYHVAPVQMSDEEIKVNVSDGVGWGTGGGGGAGWGGEGEEVE